MMMTIQTYRKFRQLWKVKGESCLLLWMTIMFFSRVNAANYYINSVVGNDSYLTSSYEAPWQSLQRLGGILLQPGDSVLFAKGSSFRGGIKLQGAGTSGQPIVITSYSYGKVESSLPRTALAALFRRYGAGPMPAFSNPVWDSLHGNVLQISGSYYRIENLYFHDNAKPPGSDRKNKNVQKMGAVYFALGANHNTVRHCEFYQTPVAIKIKGSYNLIEHNDFHDATAPLAESWGPIAIMVVKPHNEICYNRIENYGSYGGPYGSDGGVVELDGVDDDFDGRDIKIHHNISINNHGFLELAGSHVDSILVAYNLSDDTNQFIGGGSMKNVLVINNTVIRTREPNVDRYLFWTFHPEATFIIIRNNIFVMASDIQVFGPFGSKTASPKHIRVKVTPGAHDHNLYYNAGQKDPIGLAKGAGELITDPQFIDPENGNFRLKKSSPAAGAAVSTGCTSDLDDRPLPHGKNAARLSIGAYQF